jgi:hypothetical protein
MSYEWLKVIGALSFLGAWFLTWRTHSERATFEMIDRLYTLCHTLQAHLLREWRLSHLFCIGEHDYEQMKTKVAEGLEPKERSEFLAKEQMFAIHVFVVYEQVFYQWTHSSRWFHRRRRKFLKDMLSYFTERLLLNPRLQYFLQCDPEGSSLHLEKSSVEFLEKVRTDHKKAKKELDVKTDEIGPFGIAGELSQASASNNSLNPTP